MSEEIKLTLDPFGAQEAEKIAAEDVSVEQKLAELAELTSANLTEEEKAEQKQLREDYIASVRGNLKSQLDNINIQEADGSITNLGRKYGKKGQ